MKQTAQSNFRDSLKLKSIEAKLAFQKNFPVAHQYFLEKGLELGKLRQHSAKLISAGALTGTLLLSPPTGINDISNPVEIVKSVNDLSSYKEGDLPQKQLIESLKVMLPDDIRPLSRDEENKIEQIVKNVTKMPAKAGLEGEHLNTSYGYIGAEQHLKRYPGDVLENHGPYYKEGMAPGLGAWGYFSKSKSELTLDLIEKEKWYAVVQTLYLPDWGKRQPYLKNWYKYRKVIIINTKNGNAVIASIADSGPAAFTGKHFGGSPEVMEYLGGSRFKKGAVLLFFIDDPENKISLGPVKYNTINIDEENIVTI